MGDCVIRDSLIAVLVALLLSVVSAGPVAAEQLLHDRGFEAAGLSGDSPAWAEYDSFFGSPLCTVATCGDGGGKAGPRSGRVWAWFGGTGGTQLVVTQEASLKQQIRIPRNARVMLSFYLWIGSQGPFRSEKLAVKMDETTLLSIPSVAEGFESYQQVTKRVTGFADGREHTLAFLYTDPVANTGFAVNMHVDDTSLIARTRR